LKVAVAVGVNVAETLANRTHIPAEHVNPAGHMPVGQKNGFEVTNTSAIPLESLSTRFEASDTKPITVPSPLTEGRTSRVPAFAC
jgi:hypothetical protein